MRMSFNAGSDTLPTATVIAMSVKSRPWPEIAYRCQADDVAFFQNPARVRQTVHRLIVNRSASRWNYTLVLRRKRDNP